MAKKPTGAAPLFDRIEKLTAAEKNKEPTPLSKAEACNARGSVRFGVAR